MILTLENPRHVPRIFCLRNQEKFPFMRMRKQTQGAALSNFVEKSDILQGGYRFSYILFHINHI